MRTFVSDLEPRAIWQHFDQILMIPRGSGNEQEIREYIIGIVKGCSRSYEVDNVGNLLVQLPASIGYENVPTTILQSHMDMVNIKDPDLEQEYPITPELAGKYLKAHKRTLGADNGIGLSMVLAIMTDQEIIHGPIELLFTVDEEEGLVGAGKLALSLKGRFLINLDSEEKDIITVGSAGGIRLNTELPLDFERIPPGSTALEIKIKGGLSGHSGVDIHKPRANAIKFLANILNSESEFKGFYLAYFSGGARSNAIPSSAQAIVVVPTYLKGHFIKLVERKFNQLHAKYKDVEKSLVIEVVNASYVDKILKKEIEAKLLELLFYLPHGVIENLDEETVKTSSNLATIRCENGKAEIENFARSFSEESLRKIVEDIKNISYAIGANVTEREKGFGWEPDFQSELLKITKKAYEDINMKEPKVQVIHAGLECGMIKAKFPGMEAISIGPTIENPHTSNERVEIESVGTIYQIVKRLIMDIARRT